MEEFMNPETYAIVAFVLFVVSEAVGMSKFKDNSVVQLILSIGLKLFNKR